MASMFHLAFLYSCSVFICSSTSGFVDHTVVAGNAHNVENIVIKWNKLILQFIADNRISPPSASRLLALVHTAIKEAADPTLQHQSLSLLSSCAGGNDLVISTAASYALVSLYPTARSAADILERDVWQQTSCSNENKFNIQLIGEQTAISALKPRVADASARFRQYIAGDPASPTTWQPTPPDFNPNPILPNWGEVDPFGGVGTLDDLIPGPQPDVNTEEYSKAWQRAFKLGRIDSKLRTQKQTAIAKVWSMEPGTVTPPGGWNQVAQQIVAKRLRPDDLLNYSRTFWLINVAMANSAIAVWRTKYMYTQWRPVTAIRTGITGSGLPTDPSWEPLLVSPNFPEYTSGHSAFSRSAANVLTTIFGDNQLFSVSDGTTGLLYNSLNVAAEEAGLSRIYGGIHFDFSNTKSQDIGRAIAQKVCQINNCSL